MNTPKVHLKKLETVWFQVTGTLCNLQCTHCFISCGHGNNNHDILTKDVISNCLKEAFTLGAKEFYFTGGEPFLHPEITDILKEALTCGPTTVLSNGTLLTEKITQSLAHISKSSGYKLEFRISLESHLEEENDRIRGRGSFQKAKRGIQASIRAGFSPIITIADLSHHGLVKKEMGEGFRQLFSSLNAPRLRLKKIPLVLFNRCAELVRPYHENERVTERCFDDYSMDNLQCSTSRIVTSKGVFVCPILVNDPAARMGSDLKESLGPYTMESSACYTCRTSGLTCKNNDFFRL